MADADANQDLAQEEEVQDEQEQSKEGKPSFLARFKMVLIIGLVVIAECATAYVLLPGPVSADGDVPTGEAAILETQNQSGEATDEEAVPKIEVDMGKFSITNYHPDSSTTVRINFHLYGVVREEDMELFSPLFETNEARSRELVNEIFRAAGAFELTDPGLGLLKKRILEKTNRLLGKPILQESVIADYSYLEK